MHRNLLATILLAQITSYLQVVPQNSSLLLVLKILPNVPPLFLIQKKHSQRKKMLSFYLLKKKV
ncbi:histidinol dehydrogenase [Listeria monocytogenes]|nr:histidinol dehydrogenase [Listeria monocytogenes]